jgi:hypothetical protein
MLSSLGEISDSLVQKSLRICKSWGSNSCTIWILNGWKCKSKRSIFLVSGIYITVVVLTWILQRLSIKVLAQSHKCFDYCIIKLLRLSDTNNSLVYYTNHTTCFHLSWPSDHLMVRRESCSVITIM